MLDTVFGIARVRGRGFAAWARFCAAMLLLALGVSAMAARAAVPTQAVTLSVATSTTSVSSGSTTTMTMTFTNPNATASPQIVTDISVDASILARVVGAPGGTCASTGSIPAVGQIRVGIASIPANTTCTVVYNFTGGTAGSTSFTTTAFTPSGWPATAATSSSTITVSPSVTSISPTSGTTAGGTSVAINGRGFSTSIASNTVKFGTQTATITAASANRLTVNAPAGSVGAVDVEVTTSGYTAATKPTYTYTVPAPVVLSISPTSGRVAGGTVVTINGGNFTDATNVKFGTANATSFTLLDSTRISATAPAGTGTVDVVVTTPGGTSATSAADRFSYVAPPAAPTIGGPANGATVATDTPTAFGAAESGATIDFYVDDNLMGSTTTSSGGTWRFTLLTLADGPHTLRATATTDAGGTGPSTPTRTFIVDTTAPPAPVITSPAEGVTTGLRPTITGTAEANSAISISIDGSAAGTTNADASGAWSYTPSFSLSATAHTVRATASDAAGNESPLSAARNFTAVTPLTTTQAVSSASVTVGVPMTTFRPVTATGGAGTLSYAITGGTLPAGLTFSSTTGQLSGTATEALATTTFTVTVTDQSIPTPQTSSKTFQLAVVAPTITVSPTSLGSATAGVAFSQSLSASGGTASYSYSVTSGTLPAGLSLSGATLSGTPTAVGSFNFAITATDSSTGTGAPFSGTRTYTLTVAAPTITLAPTTLPQMRAGAAYTQTLSASGGNGSYSYAVTAGALPPGLSLSPTGTLSGTPTASDQFNFTITVTDQTTGPGAPYRGSAAYTVNVQSPFFTLTEPTLSATAGQPYSGNFVAGGGTAPYTYSRFSGTLPPGLTLGSDGTLSGTPTAAGSYNFAVVARDSTTGSAGPFAVGSGYTFVVNPAVVSISTGTLTGGTVGSAYSATISAADGIAPYRYAVTAGALPPGLSLSTGGAITGTPTAGGSFGFTVTATDSGGTPASADKAFTLTIAAPTIAVTPASLPAATVGTPFTQALSASGGTGSYSYQVTAGALPVGLTLSPAGQLSGTPTAAGSFSATVTATDSSTGSGPYTGSTVYAVTVAKGAQTLSFTSTAPTSATVGGATYTPAASATSTLTPVLTIDASSSAVCAISGGVVRFTGVGTCRINADQAGDANWTAASQVQQSFAVAPTPLVTTQAVASVSASVGTPITTAAPVTATGGTGALGYTLTGGTLPAGLSFSTVTGELSGTPTTALSATTFTVTVTDQAGPTPQTSAKTFQLTVAKGAQTLTFTSTAPTAATVGGATYTPMVTANSGLTPTLSIASTSSAVCTISGGVVRFTGIGTCRINADRAGDANWNAASQVQQSFAVAATPLVTTQAVASATGAVGTPLTSFTPVTASGGMGTLSYALSGGTLPGGLSFSTSTGEVSGTPTTALSATTFTVTVTDQTAPGAQTSAKTFQLAVAKGTQTLSFTSTAPASAKEGGAAYTPTVSVNSMLTPVLTIDSASNAVCAISGGVVRFTGAGTCRINADQPGDANWNAANQAQQSFAVGAAAPVAADKPGVAVAYNSSGTAIDLAGSVSGVSTGLALGTAPAHGSVSFAGTVATYTPTAGYYGADSFTYTASGPGGTSAPATVSVTVGTPAAPVAADKQGVAVAYNSSGTAIDLAGSVSGVSTGLALGTAPAHGSVSFAGTVATYTPTAGYFGADSFTYTATGPGGTSVPATVSVTVATPTAPVAADKQGVAVAYNSSGTAIDLAGSVSGVSTGLALGTAPAHGSVSFAGTVATYAPTAGYFGADSFTYTATGPGGASAPATVSVTVATPAAPVAADKPGVSVGYNSSGTAIDLAGSVSGVSTSLALGTAPAHGSVSFSGTTATYTPTAGYFGADSFTYTATGPGGTSAPATVSLTVATPAAPVAADKAGVAVAYNSSGTAIDLAGSVSGVSTSLALGTAPAHGSVSFAGTVATYTPTAGYFGVDSFTYTATGPGGASAPATVSVTVATPAAPVAADKPGVSVGYNSSGTAIDLAGSVSGVSTGLALGTAPAHGSVSFSGTTATYTPTAGYFGVDSFTYTATGPGGTSAPATVSLTVATPAAPVAADKAGVAVAYDSSGTAIDLAGSVSGVSTDLALGTAPAHGSVSFAGNVATYTPTAGYFGADSFTYTATGPGGTSAPATVSVTVGTPAAPVVADKPGVAIAYNSGGTAIDLAGSVSGVSTGLALGTAPAHGSVSFSGITATYTPTAGYYGPDSFTYTATGPGGTSAPASVSVTVATPPIADVAGLKDVAVAYDSPGTRIDLTNAVSGVVTSLSVGTAPAHGIVSIVGRVATYTPVTGYYGDDSFTYTATGPGGTSAPALVTLTVAAPPAPVAQSGTASVTGTADASLRIDLGALVSGEFAAVQIATQPAHGTVTLQNAPTMALASAAAAPVPTAIAVYRPAAGYVGTDSFTFIAVGPGGSSAPATVTVTVLGPKPTAQPKAAATGDGQMVSIDLTAGATGGPFTAAAIVSMTPADAATTRLVEGGSAGNRTYTVEVTPKARFGGTVAIAYTLSNAYATSEPATVTITVTARPDPSADATVRGVVDAQAEAARRFARSQVGNFLRRTEQLHGGGGTARAQMGFTLSSRDGNGPLRQRPAMDDSALAITERMRKSSEDPALGAVNQKRGGSIGLFDAPASGGISVGAPSPAATARGAASAPAPEAAEDAGGAGGRKVGSVAIWSGGAIEIGTRDRDTDRTKVTATTSGLSGGADIKLAPGVTVGIGGGYGNDISSIDGGAARVRGTNSLFAAYASITPGEGLFIDAVAGRGDLSFTTRRNVSATGGVATGSRDGTMTLAALSFGVDVSDAALRFAIYGRGEYLDADLGAYVEAGAGRYNLRFDAREVRSVTGTLGTRIEYRQTYSFGTFLPRLRAEWNHEFADVDAQMLDYADIAGASFYRIDGSGWRREQFQLSLGTRLELPSLWAFDIETGFRGGSGETAATLRLLLSKSF